MEQLETKDGATLDVRGIEPTDKDALLAAFDRLSPESRYLRFLAPVNELAPRTLRYLTEVDHTDHEALIALDAHGDIVGVARYVRLRERPDVAEAAVTVADEWQGRGVGTELLRRLAARAGEAGVEKFTATCLTDNRDIQRLLEELGSHMRTRSRGEGVEEIEIELPTAGEEQSLWAALRAAAAGTLRLRPGDPAHP